VENNGKTNFAVREAKKHKRNLTFYQWVNW